MKYFLKSPGDDVHSYLRKGQGDYLKVTKHLCAVLVALSSPRRKQNACEALLFVDAQS
jgi:hypothetical protein